MALHELIRCISFLFQTLCSFRKDILLFKNNLSYFCPRSFVSSFFWSFPKYCQKVLVLGVFISMRLPSYLLTFFLSQKAPDGSGALGSAIQMHSATKGQSLALPLWWMEKFSGLYFVSVLSHRVLVVSTSSTKNEVTEKILWEVNDCFDFLIVNNCKFWTMISNTLKR